MLTLAWGGQGMAASQPVSDAGKSKPDIFFDFQNLMPGKRVTGFDLLSDQFGWVGIVDTSDMNRSNHVITNYLGHNNKNGNYALVKIPPMDLQAGSHGANFTVLIKIDLISGPPPRCAGLVTDFENSENFSYVAFEVYEKSVEAVQVRSGNFFAKRNAVQVYHLASSTWYTLKLVYAAKTLSVYLDNVLLFRSPRTDNRSPKFVGPYVCRKSVGLFDDLKISFSNEEQR